MNEGAEWAAAAAVWAKSWPGDTDVEKWLPLWQHLDDTADVAGRLWDRWLAPSVRRLVGDALPDGEDDGRKLLVWLAGVHDIGKATPAFAVQAEPLADAMVREGLKLGPTVHDERTRLRHEIAGAAIIDRWLEDYGITRRTSGQLTAVIAGHHGTFPMPAGVTSAWADHQELMGDGLWPVVQTALADRAAERARVTERLPAWQSLLLPQTVQMMLTGVVAVADWIASATELFPLRPVDDVPHVPEADLAHNAARLDRGWAKVTLGPRWAPWPQEVPVQRWFRDRFSREPRPVQEAAGSVATTMPAQGLMIIEAPPGAGKTEAALLAVEALAARAGCTGCFIAVPDQATPSAVVGRARAWLDRLPGGAGAGRTPGAAIQDASALGVGLSSFASTDPGDVPVHDELDAADVAEWMTGRKHAALSSFTVGTIDQVLEEALLARHVVLRQLSLAGKVVLLDEVHASDTDTSTFLDRALEWLAAAGTPVVLLSNALPAQLRAELYWAYERGRQRLVGPDVPIDEAVPPEIADLLAGDIGYPSIVTTGDDGPTVTAVPSGESTRRVATQRLDDDLETLGDTLDRDLRDGGCAVVIRSTAHRVQETADYLAARFGPADVTVAHADFLAVDRAENDLDLLHRFGPPGAGVERPQRHIVVASRVVEQALDIDFDVLVTDLAPVDLLLQRMGRLHRHRRGDDEADRPESLRTPRCYVTGVDWTADPPRPSPDSRQAHPEWLLDRAVGVLTDALDGAGVALPDDIGPLVQGAYSDDQPEPATWGRVSRAAALERDARLAAQAERVATFALPPVRRHGIALYGLSRLGMGPVDEDSPAGQACVRDGGGTLEVVVVQRGDDGVDRTPDWLSERGGEALPPRDARVPRDLARVLAACTVRLPAALTEPEAIDAVIGELSQDRFDGWGRSDFLSGRLALVLDSRGRRRLAGRAITYDRRSGLRAVAE